MILDNIRLFEIETWRIAPQSRLQTKMYVLSDISDFFR